jgi:hypothetical protein
MALTDNTGPRRARGMGVRDDLPAAAPPPLPARLVPGRLVHIPRAAMFGKPVRHLNVMVIEFWRSPAYNLGQLRCVDVATGYRMRLWVRPLLITAYHVASPADALPTAEYPEAC